MASSVDEIAAPTAETQAPAIGSCLNDPNYAIICAFLQKFGAHLKIDCPDFVQLQKMIENTDEVHSDLKQFMVKLLRKTRKSVQPDKLDSALAKFGYTYSAQDAWEIERFGFKNSSLAVKLRILKEILESQFEKNPAFRAIISAQSGSDLRSHPLGKDKLGNAYWHTWDEQCNMRIYQEHLDEETWKIVATNRDEMAKLISSLKGNELVMPSLVGLVDEDSSSNSMPPKVDALKNGSANKTANGTSDLNGTNGNCAAEKPKDAEATRENVPSLKIKLNSDGESTVEQIKPNGNHDDVAGDGSDVDESSQAASESSATTVGTKSNETQSSKRFSLMASKPPPNKSKHRIAASDAKAKANDRWSSKRNLQTDEANAPKNKRPSMMNDKKASNKYKANDYDDSEASISEDGEEEEEDVDDDEDEFDEEMSEISEGDVGDEIEEPTIYVRGEGTGKANKCDNEFLSFAFDSDTEPIVGEVIEEETIFVLGEGAGHDCDVGNNDVKANEASSSESTPTTAVVPKPKPMFFFGQAGCLKLSPIKTVPKSSSTEVDEPSDDKPEENELKVSDAKDDTEQPTNSCENSDEQSNSKTTTEAKSETKNVPVEAEVNESESQSEKIEEVENSAEQNCDEQNNDENQVENKSEIENEVEESELKSDEKEDENVEKVSQTNVATESTNKIEAQRTVSASAALESESSPSENIEPAKSSIEEEKSASVEPKLSDEKVEEIGASEDVKETETRESKSEQIVEKSVVDVAEEDIVVLSERQIEPTAEAAAGPVPLSEVAEGSKEIDEMIDEQEKETIEMPSEDIQSDENEIIPQKVNEPELPQPDTEPATESTVIESEGKTTDVAEEIEENVESLNKTDESEVQPEVQTEPKIEKNIPEIEETKNEQSEPEVAEEATEALQVDESSEKVTEKIIEPEEINDEQENIAEEQGEKSQETKSVLEDACHPHGDQQKEDKDDENQAPAAAVEVTEPEVEETELEETEKEIVAKLTPNEVADAVTECEEVNEEKPIALEKNEKVEEDIKPITSSEKRKATESPKTEENESKKKCEENSFESRPQTNAATEQIATVTEVPEINEDDEKTKENINDEKADVKGLEKEVEDEKIVESTSEVKVETEVTEATPTPAPTTIQEEVKETSQKEEIAVKEEELPPTAIELAQPSNERQLGVSTSRTRKRRLSGEKVRLSSESENDHFDTAAIESPATPSENSDEEVGGKRLKMRAKIPLKNLRKSIEDKRSLKEECSSDDNEKLSAKQKLNDSRPKLRTRRRRGESMEAQQPAKPVKEVKETAEEATLKEEAAEEQSVEVKLEEQKVVKKEFPKEKIEPEIESQPIDVKTEESTVEEGHDGDSETAGNDANDEATNEEATEAEIKGPSRRGGRGRGGKAARKAAARDRQIARQAALRKEREAKAQAKKDTAAAKPVPKAREVTPEPKPLPAKVEPRKKKRSLLGLDADDVAIITASADGDTPVRQSRRIAQIKIKEEAERRKAEEVALEKLKAASEKKKKGPERESINVSEEENSESEQKLEKKKKRKKGNKDKPWQTDSSDLDEHDDEDLEHDDHEDHERLPPLRSDHEFSPESDIEDESQIVPTKRARTARKDVREKNAEESEPEDIHACQKCAKNDHPEWILLCDKCDKGYHCSCLIPVLFVIPEGDWFCPPCQQDKLIETLEVKLQEYDAALKAKEIEEAKQQRILYNAINEANVLKESKRDKQRARAADRRNRYDDEEDFSSSSSNSDDDDDGDDHDKNGASKSNDNRREKRATTQRSRKRSESSATNSSDDEPIYKLRKRRQAVVSYRFNEYDELINRAIKSEMDEVAGAGNLGRGKDINTIIEADKEERRKLEQEKENDENETNEKHSDGNSDSEPIKPKVVNRKSRPGGKKKKKLNSLDDESDFDDDADSDDDFKTSSFSEDEEENFSGSSVDSESSLEPLSKKKNRYSARRSVRERKKRFEADFIDDNSDDEDDIPLSKKKKKEDTDFSDFGDSSEEEVEEDVDSDELCDDSTDESDRPWSRSKKSKNAKSSSGTRSSATKTAAKKKPKNEDEDDDDDDEDERPFKATTKKKKKQILDSDEENEGDSPANSRRTRGKKLNLLLDDDFDSSDDGIKPGVKRPDTPPEEREAFIKKQEEIKRMLAEKNATKTPEKGKRNVPKDSLSTIPPQIIQSAKALDVDLRRNRNASDNESNDFDDDLPEDFDPEDMDEDEIAKMMEEEEFAQQQLKLAGEVIRSKKNKEAEVEKKEISPIKVETPTNPLVSPSISSIVSPTTFAGSLTIPDIPPSMYTAQSASIGTKISTTPKKRGRGKLKEEIPLPGDGLPKSVKSLEQILPMKESILSIPTIPTIQHTSMQQLHPKAAALSQLLHAPQLHSPPIQHTPSVIAHSSVIQSAHQRPLIVPPPVSSSLLGIARTQEPIIPSTILGVQNTRLLDPSELAAPSAAPAVDPSLLDSPVKKRGRRKKFTPMKDSDASAPPATAGVDLRHVGPPTSSVAKPTTATNALPEQTKPSILSERLTGTLVKDNKRGLSVATPPHLYTPPTSAQPSVITRLARPSHNVPFTAHSSVNAPPQRYFAPNHSLPAHSLPSHVRPPYHSSNTSTSSSHRPPPHGNSSSSGSHLTHPMYIRGQPSMYPPGYPGIPTPQMHRALQAMEAGSNPQEFTGPYQNLPFGNYYPPPGPAAAHLPTAERRPGSIIGQFEQFDSVSKGILLSHERGAPGAVFSQHLPSTTIASISTSARHAIQEVDDDRSAGSGSNGPSESTAAPAGGTGGSEFSGLVSYFSSQQDDLDT